MFRALGNPMKHEAQVFKIASPTKEIIISVPFFSSQTFFVHIMVAQKLARAVRKHSLPCLDGECREQI